MKPTVDALIWIPAVFAFVLCAGNPDVLKPELSERFKSFMLPVANVDVVPPTVLSEPVPKLGVVTPVEVNASLINELKSHFVMLD